MNRRNLIKRCGQALVGIGAVAVGVKAERPPITIERSRAATKEELHIFIHAEPGKSFQHEVVQAVVNDIKQNGPTREVITRVMGG